jgi:hypothetical protein
MFTIIAPLRFLHPFRKSPAAMSARKLSNDDVVEIFRCIHTNSRVPEKRLRFQIIVVGSNGMKLLPPSYKFDGKEWSKVETLQPVLDFIH